MTGKDLLSRLADAGEDAIGKLSKAPGGEQFVGAMHAMRERTDELQKRLRGLDVLEARVAELEKRLQALEGPKRTPARRAASSSGRTTRSGTSGRKTTSRSPGTKSNGGSATGDTGGNSPG